MPDLFAAIAADHRAILALLDRLSGEPGVEVPPSQRGLMAEQLVMGSSRHEAAEEQYLWPVVRDALDVGGDLASDGLGQEQQAKHLLEQLDGMSPRDDGFDDLVARIAEDTRAHVMFEQATVLPLLRLRLDDRQAHDIGERFLRARDKAPTRPHPHTPPNPGLLKSAGRLVGLLDRARDVLDGRGH